MKDNKIPFSTRFPQKLHDKIIRELREKNDSLKTEKDTKDKISKTDIVINALSEYYKSKEKNTKKLINDVDSALKDIDSAISIENKVFLPKTLYRQLLGKPEHIINEEVNLGIIQVVIINSKEFVILSATLNTNAIMLELLIQKKQIAQLNEKIGLAK